MIRKTNLSLSNPHADMKVSAIIPVYNGERWLSEAIASIKNQTRPVDELIVVDDASKDKSAEIATESGAKVIRLETNSGEGAARNAGLRHAVGDVVAWLDADDVWTPKHIETLLSLLELYPEATAAFGAVQRFGLRHELIKGRIPLGKPANVFWAAVDNWVHTTIGSMTRRDALLSIGGFSTDLRYSVDYDLWLRLSRDHLFVCTHEITSFWRWHEFQQSQNFAKQLQAVYYFRHRYLNKERCAGCPDVARRLDERINYLWKRDFQKALDSNDLNLARALLICRGRSDPRSDDDVASINNQLLDSWGKKISSEFDFWHHWVATKGDTCPNEYAARMARHTPLDPFFAELLGAADLNKVKILDVGAGPISGLGKVHKGTTLDITACDPLADYYDTLCDSYKLKPPVRTIKSFAEDLASFFPSNHFDLVTCTNALDHSFEPVRGIAHMLEVVKPGAAVVLQHPFNEAEKTGYSGPRQWNFDIQAGRLIIWNRDHRFDVGELFASFANIRVEDRSCVTAIITKQAPISPAGLLDPRSRVRELLELLISYRAQDSARAAGAERRAARAEARAAKLEARAIKAEGKTAKAEARTTKAKARMAKLESSLSWRITRPLRGVFRIVKAAGPRR